MRQIDKKTGREKKYNSNRLAKTALLMAIAITIFFSFSFCTKQERKSNAFVKIFDTNEDVDTLYRLVAKAKESGDDQALIDAYTRVINIATVQDKTQIAELYIDSLYSITKTLNDSSLTASYHILLGNYYNQKNNLWEAQQQYYKALDSYPVNSLAKMSALYNIAVYYIQQEDAETLKTFVYDALELVEGSDNYTSLITAYRIAYYYYSLLSNIEPENTLYKDSSGIYSLKTIELFEKDSSSYFPHIIANDYTNAAGYLLSKDKPDMELINNYLEKSNKYISKEDGTGILNILTLRFRMEIMAGNYAKCREIMDQQHDIFENDLLLKHRAYVGKNIYQKESKLAEAQHNYKDALKYERLKGSYSEKNYRENMYSKVEELKRKYQNEKQLRIIEQNEADIKINKLINKLLLGLSFTFIVMIYFLVRWSKAKRQKEHQERELAEQELRELEAIQKLRKEEFKNMELELKEVEIEKYAQEQDNTLLRDRLNIIEEDMERARQKRAAERCLTLRVTRDKIVEKLKPSENRTRYLKMLDMLNKNFVDKLTDMGLTTRDIEYCIVFILRLETAEIALLLNVKPLTVRMRKSAIKRQYFALEGERVSLETLLFDLLFDCVDYHIPIDLMGDLS